MTSISGGTRSINNGGRGMGGSGDEFDQLLNQGVNNNSTL